MIPFEWQQKELGTYLKVAMVNPHDVPAIKHLEGLLPDDCILAIFVVSEQDYCAYLESHVLTHDHSIH